MLPLRFAVCLLALAPAFALSAPAPQRDERESIRQLEAQAAALSHTVGELQPLALKINGLQVQVNELQTTLQQHRTLLENAEGRQRSPGWLRTTLVFILGLASGLLVLFGYQLFRGYDEAPLPPEISVFGASPSNLSESGSPPAPSPTPPAESAP